MSESGCLSDELKNRFSKEEPVPSTGMRSLTESEWRSRMEREAGENAWNPYYCDVLGKESYSEWMTRGPKTLTLFKVISVDDLSRIVDEGIRPIAELVDEGRPPTRRWVADDELAKGEGDESYWSLGKVNLFYGGKEGKVLLVLNPEILNQQNVRYRKKDPANTWGKPLEVYPAAELSLEDLPDEYWSDWWRSYEVMIPETIPFQEIEVSPLDPKSKQELDTLGIGYTVHEEKYPTTEHWALCGCGDTDSPFGEHTNIGYCG